jgi:hypothetical protein
VNTTEAIDNLSQAGVKTTEAIDNLSQQFENMSRSPAHIAAAVTPILIGVGALAFVYITFKTKPWK